MIFKVAITVVLILSFYLVLLIELISGLLEKIQFVSRWFLSQSILSPYSGNGDVPSGEPSKGEVSSSQSLANRPSIPNSDTSAIALLAKEICEVCSQLSSYPIAAIERKPGFSAVYTDVPKTPEYESLRARLNDTTLDLLCLVNGPKSTLRTFAFSHYDLAALQIAVERGFFNHVPLQGSVNAAKVAERAGMDEDRTTRLLSFLATRRIFEEVGSGSSVFKHTAMSALMATDRDFHAMVHMQMDEMFKAASEASNLLERSPYVSDTENSAFCTRFGIPAYVYYEQNPQKGARFAQSMDAWSRLDGQVTKLVHSSFPWASLNNGKVVDIGGGSGHISIALAKVYPSLRFIVQDASERMLSRADEEVVRSLGGRVTFQRHNFFEPQPVHDANAFLLRQCLHNYSDNDCIKIAGALVPALEKCDPGTPLLLNEIILPENGSTTRHVEHHLRQVDMTMMIVLGAKQRSRREFEQLLKKADPRFEVRICYLSYVPLLE
ncbi:putative O-methyltransferase [Aspergillus clavatus NRRL 1]|uniref:O-methyltransferase, putative n=1 Tax=Aspergillus clavatus (strain ATCC 1007 / CBS 513.65 / DSM 816 / NCTC 3887 / NRRL 1 / QM 1276 / 107) TaxID=344612 RepID=A1CCB7_ASPCL|nr:O-methyltransferase, putative [Aspergillus clavatus NRRL 1]EAW12174.1 O-methyltransferase, putative [Aspergillus clavatus NRRL 1]